MNCEGEREKFGEGGKRKNRNERASVAGVWAHVRVYACVCTRVYVMCVCMWLCVLYTCTYACMRVCALYEFAGACVCVRVYVCARIQRTRRQNILEQSS